MDQWVSFSRQIAFLCACVVMAACSTVELSDSYSFVASEDEVLILTERPGFADSAIFHAVDLEKGEFVGSSNTVQFVFPGRVLVDPENSSNKLSVITVPPGDYAYAGYVTSSSSGSVTTITTNCFAEGTSVYRLEPGTINAIPLPGIFRRNGGVGSTNEGLQSEMDAILAGYPSVEGERVVPERVAGITFDGGKQLLRGVQCPKGRTLTVMPDDFVPSTRTLTVPELLELLRAQQQAQ